MRMYDIIHKKRDGGVLSEKEIRYFVNGYTNGDIPDYQASALLMAIYFNGMNEFETAVLTDSMTKSGKTIDLSRFGKLSADKHSTGGVGDKTTLIVAPIVASLGGKVAKMSGRGLGHTGGTVDKLEAIKGFKTSLSTEEFMNIAESVGVVVAGQTENLAPADKKLYALRDVTATVESVPLIASSVMSKKLASGAQNIVLDVKCGSGAFMKTPADAAKLAKKMVEIGTHSGRNVRAIVTNMDKPLGNAIGNALEVKEAVGVLRGEIKGELRKICISLSSNMLSLCLQKDICDCEKECENAIDSGKAFAKFKEWISAQGGDLAVIENTDLLPTSEITVPVISWESGYIQSVNAEQAGLCSVILGAGRANKNDTIDMSAGIVTQKTVGDYISKGEAIAFLHTNRHEVIDDASRLFIDAIKIGGEKPPAEPLIYEIIKSP